MASGTNSIKNLSNLFRSRLTLAYELTELIKPSLNKNKDKLIELLKEKAGTFSQSELARKMRVAKGFYALEMAPPTSRGDIQKIISDLSMIKDFIKGNCYKHLTVKQAWLLFLVGLEVYLWFYLGETFGKMHIVGYKV